MSAVAVAATPRTFVRWLMAWVRQNETAEAASLGRPCCLLSQMNLSIHPTTDGANAAAAAAMKYRYWAVERFWTSFYRLSPAQKESARRAWIIFKADPFDPPLRKGSTATVLSPTSVAAGMNARVGSSTESPASATNVL